MRIGSSSGVSILASRLRAANARRVPPGGSVSATGGDRPTGRALTPVEPSMASEAPVRLVRFVADAAFLAQLVATAEELPQTRRLRRAEPARAAAAYARTARGEGLLTPGYLVDLAR